MKRIISIFLCFLLCFSMAGGFLPARAAGQGVPITEAYFPDPVFRAFLDTNPNGEHIDANRNGWLEEGERAAVRVLYMDKSAVTMDSITDLTGIEFFPNLEYLMAHGHSLSFLDVTQNMNLTMLDVSDNLLTMLDLSHNMRITDVRCQNNNLNRLILNGKSRLETLYCSGNQLTELVLGGCDNLMWLEMEQNNLREVELPSMPNMMLVAPCFQKTQQPVTLVTRERSWCFSVAHNPTNGSNVYEDSYYDPADVRIDPSEGKLVYNAANEKYYLQFNPGVTSIRVNLNKTQDGHQYPAAFILKLWQEPVIVTYQWVEEVPATCTETGMMGYYAGSDGNRYLEDGQGNLAVVSADDLILPALGHDWLPTEYSWSDDYSSCRADRKCSHQDAGLHGEGTTALSKAEVTRYPTYTDPGETRYEADFLEDWAENQVIFVPGVPDDYFKVGKFYDASMGFVTCVQSVARKGETVEFHVEPYDGFRITNIRITTQNEDIPCTALGNGNYHFTAPGCECGIVIEFAADVKDFVDVSPNAYYYEAVQWAVANKITEGKDSTHFCPDMNCTRAQAVSFIWRASGCPEPMAAASPFADVSMSSYYAKAVLWAVEQGITSGYGDGTYFRPDQVCTRAQIVSFLYRGSGRPAVSGKLPFTDVPGGAYYADAVRWAVQKQITAGKTPTAFLPNANCTRAQIVSFLMRAQRSGG